MPAFASQISQLFIQGFSVKNIVIRQIVHWHTFIQVNLHSELLGQFRESDLIHGIGRGVPNGGFVAVLSFQDGGHNGWV